MALKTSFKATLPGFNLKSGARKVDLETDRFRVRTLERTDASEPYLSWIGDAKVMGPLNMPPRQLSLAELDAYIAGFDSKHRHLIGMFDRKTGQHFGIFVIDVNHTHRAARLSFLIGEANYQGIGAFQECATALVSHLFSSIGLEKLLAQVITSNKESAMALETLGFEREGLMRGEVLHYKGEERLDQYFYGLLKADWKPS